MASFDHYLKMLEQFNKQLNSFASPLIDSTTFQTTKIAADLNQMAYSPIQELAESFSDILSLNQERYNNLAIGNANSLVSTLTYLDIAANDIQNILPPVVSQIATLNETFSAGLLSKAFEPLISSINHIHIFSDYVEVPEELIPEKLFPEAIPSENTTDNTPIKKLSRDQTLTIISILLSLMFWILNNISPTPWQQKYHNEIVQSLEMKNNLLEESNQIQAERIQLDKEQLQATKEKTQAIKEQTQATKEKTQAIKEQTQATKEQTQVLNAIAYLLGIQDSLLSPEAVTPPESSDTDLTVQGVDPELSAADPKAATAEAEPFPSAEPHPIPD